MKWRKKKLPRFKFKFWVARGCQLAVGYVPDMNGKCWRNYWGIYHVPSKWWVRPGDDSAKLRRLADIVWRSVKDDPRASNASQGLARDALEPAVKFFLKFLDVPPSGAEKSTEKNIPGTS